MPRNDGSGRLIMRGSGKLKMLSNNLKANKMTHHNKNNDPKQNQEQKQNREQGQGQEKDYVQNQHQNPDQNIYSSIRREYGTRVLSEDSVQLDPMAQFQIWFDEIVLDEVEPTAMSLATVDKSGRPDLRIVLLKGIEDGSFLFYTHYDSAKGQEMAHNNHVALNFFWTKYIRQVRVRGTVAKISPEISDEYFASRPLLSQLSAVASHQSHAVLSRKVLENQVIDLAKQYENKQIPRPELWGGYAVIPQEIEFWQGRDNRLHDRIRYSKNENGWTIERLAP